MKTAVFSPQSHTYNEKIVLRRYQSWLPFFTSLLFAALTGAFCFMGTIVSNLVGIIVSLGLDPLRSQLVAALFLAAGSGYAGGLIGRKKFGAMLGGGLAFAGGYLLNFFQQELQPVRDPGGHLEALDTWALLHTTSMMVGLALLCAFIGAAIGAAFGEVLLDPLQKLAQISWQHVRTLARHTLHSSQASVVVDTPEKMPMTTSGTWWGFAALAIILVLVSNSTVLFTYSPDVGLHVAPTLIGKNGHVLRGTTLEDSLISKALGGQKRSFIVYLPPSYNTLAGRTERYPTLYLLHGVPGRDSDWITGGKADETMDTLIALGKTPEMILIMPDGNGRPGETSEWGNSADHRQMMEDYIVKELIPYVDQKYRTLPQARYRGIGGLSMGGFGATNIALHHPDMFSFVISLGGYYRPEGSIWGDNSAYIAANTPIRTLQQNPQNWKLYMYIGAATHDQPYYHDSMEFVAKLKKLHMHYHLDIQPGYHSWRVWQVQFYNAVQWLQSLPQLSGSMAHA